MPNQYYYNYNYNYSLQAKETRKQQQKKMQFLDQIVERRLQAKNTLSGSKFSLKRNNKLIILCVVLYVAFEVFNFHFSKVAW